MNLRDITLEALAYIRPSNASSNQATIALASVRQLARIAADATATLQDIYRAARSFYRRPISGTLAAPTTVSVAVTADQQAFTSVSTIPYGSTIVIDGDTTYNRAIEVGGSKTLLYPYRGTTGTHSAIVYGDVLVLSSAVAKVIGHCRLSNGDEVRKAVNEADLYRFSTESPDYGRRRLVVSSTPIHGQPSKYWVEADVQTSATLLLRVNPMPKTAIGISFKAQLVAPRIEVADLGDDSTESTVDLIIPEDAIESLFKPLFLHKWSRSPWWEDEESKRRIKDEAGPAMATLASYRAMDGGAASLLPVM
jgi:hypothetical protein